MSDTVWGPKVRKVFPLLRSNPKTESHRRPSGEAPFFAECRTALRNLPGFSDLSWSRKELYQAPGSGFLNNSGFSLTWWLAWNALPLAGWAFKAGLADMLDCTRCSSGLEETASHAYYSNQVRLFWGHVGEWTAHIGPKQLVLLEFSYIVDNVDLPWKSDKRVVFLAILAVARMAI